MATITAAVLGAGSRGTNYSNYSLLAPEELKIVAVAEPREDRRKGFAEKFSVPAENCFESWEELLAKPKLADALFVCTLDEQHMVPAMKALEKGYHVLLEKPMSNREDECVAIEAAARKSGKVLTVCHVLRYTAFYQTLKRLIDEGAVGEITNITQIENVAYWHQAHSYVRGNWRDSEETSPMILAKCCHDADILLWLSGKDCRKVHSFGSLRHFVPENAPEGAPARCLDGCPHAESCIYYAPKIYPAGKTDWPVDVITTDLTAEGITRALKEGPYGRCVYHCDNNVVDRQVVTMEMEDGSLCSLTMTAFSQKNHRELKIHGTKGLIEANMDGNEIWLQTFGGDYKKIDVDSSDTSGHGGGDYGLLRDFLMVLQSGGESLTSARKSLQSHLICFAAERSRLEGKVIEL